MQAVGADLVGMVENQGGAELADRGRAEAFGARHLQHGLLVQIVAAEMLVDIARDTGSTSRNGVTVPPAAPTG